MQLLVAHRAIYAAPGCSGSGPSSSTAPAAGLGQTRACRLPQRRPLLPVCAAGGQGQNHPEEGDRPMGDSGLQDSLVQQLQFEIGKKRVGDVL